MQITKDTVASIHYALTDPEGKTLDSSEGKAPLAYLHGAGQIVPGLENALEGKAPGDKLNVTVPPTEGYGERHEQLVGTLPKSKFGPDAKVEVGMVFQAQSPDGQRGAVRVVGVEGDNVTVDANHPLAGIPLTFDVTVDAVRKATAEELQHGHAHGPGGHSHG